jgi:uncharacterized protein with ParB-like and HNH nuclease domain
MPLSQSSSIKSEERSIGSILADKRTLRVPAYQRSFSWTKVQIDDLWEDIQSILYDGQEPYFLGSMVFIQKADNSLEVVDGQQRLATVSLLLAAIRDGFAAVDDKARAQHVETHYLCSRSLKSLEAAPKLSLNETDNDLYCQIVDAKKDYATLATIARNRELMESNRLLARAYVTFHDLVKKASTNFSNTVYLSTLVEAITDGISGIQIITNNEDSAYVLFETLNDRGIDLTLSDMLKNFLFSKAGKRIDEAKNKWTQIVTLIGQEYMKTFIRHEWMSKYGQTREKELYKKIKTEVRSNPKAIEYITNLREAANIYDAIRNPDHEIWAPFGSKCQQLLEDILLLGPIQCYPLILSTYLARPKELSTVLTWITNLTVRYSIISAKGTGNLETAYARASSAMRKTDKKMKEVKAILLNIWPNDDEFQSSFKEKTLSSPRIIKYLLAKIEVTISKDDSLIPNPDTLSVEHVLPKKPGPKWPTKMRSADFLKENVSKIGNLTILTEPMNRECESREFSFKKTIYKDSKYKLSQELCQLSDWTETEIEQRQARLADIAASIWVI